MKKVIVGISFFVSIILIVLILSHHITWFDSFCYEHIIWMKTKPITDLFIVISDVISIFIMICLSFFIVFKNKKFACLVSLNLGLSFGISYLLKEIFKRARPIGIALVVEHGYSMPSSHAMVSISFLGLLFYYLYKNYPKGGMKAFLLTFLLGYIFLIGVSRIYLGVHYASDVLLGYTVGILYLTFFVHLFKKDIIQKKESI